MGQFTLDMAKFVEKCKGDMNIVARKTTLGVFSRVVKRSPVDTGRFRGNWMYSVGSPSRAVDNNKFDKTGDSVIADIDSKLPVKMDDVFFLTNNLPYANRLENGWSKQSPQGMVGLTVIEFDQVLKGAVK